MSAGADEAPERAFLVTDLGFGDAGKGLVVDHLVRRTGARLVVRHNGGAQAGHNVVTPDGRHHCFAQLGAGSFVPGTRTHLSRFFVLHPTALMVEAARLSSRGVGDVLERVEVDARARVITPYHQAACRLRELARGDAPHGSCGVGVGEAVGDALDAGGDAVRAAHLRDPGDLLRRLTRTRERVYARLGPARHGVRVTAAMADELHVFEDASVATRWLEATRAFVASVAVVEGEALERALREPGAVVFEGAQGVLLDQDWGFHPHTTWSRTTSANARALLAEACPERPITSLGVLRSYCVRHGAGPMPSEAVTLGLDTQRERHNPTNAWQGELRRGALDLVLLRYALEVEHGVDGLVLTHLDALAGRERWPLVTAYAAPEKLTQLPLDSAPTLARQAELGRRLNAARCRPEWVEASSATSLEDALAARLGEELGVRVTGRSHGPTANSLALDL